MAAPNRPLGPARPALRAGGASSLPARRGDRDRDPPAVTTTLAAVWCCTHPLASTTPPLPCPRITDADTLCDRACLRLAATTSPTASDSVSRSGPASRSSRTTPSAHPALPPSPPAATHRSHSDDTAVSSPCADAVYAAVALACSTTTCASSTDSNTCTLPVAADTVAMAPVHGSRGAPWPSRAASASPTTPRTSTRPTP